MQALMLFIESHREGSNPSLSAKIKRRVASMGVTSLENLAKVKLEGSIPSLSAMFNLTVLND